MQKLRCFRLVLVTIALVCGVFLSVSASASTSCEDLTKVKLDHATFTSARIATGDVLSDIKGGSAPLRAAAAFCRIRITDTPTTDSVIQTELWLPLFGWDGRFKGFGNGGFAGEIAYYQMHVALNQGMAVAATDAGHVGGTATFALGHPEKVNDFGWRAVHDMTVQAKQLTAAFYGTAPKHSYFMACSDGGREALMEAQRFPQDYDGILAGAPAYNWTALVSSGAQDEHRLHSSPATDIPVAKLPAIGAAARAACDAKDGVTDGVIDDPRSCHFNTAILACKGAETDACLTGEQIKSLNEIYTAKKDAKGTSVYPGFLPGAEDHSGSWGSWVLGDHSLMLFFSTGFFSNFVYQQPAWTLASFDFNKDYALATTKTGAALNATDSNLKPFADHGGRMILYHGWNDAAIPALGTVDYYDRAKSALGTKKADESLRLYMVPGMQHCSGGPGVTGFGQEGIYPQGDATHDVFTALEQWVETSHAPQTLTASSYTDGHLVKTRPLCPYPLAAQYTGGNPNDEKSFVCKAPGQ